MFKTCTCGKDMEVTLRTLYFKKLEIRNVPVYSCPTCQHNELFHQVKKKIQEIVYDNRNTIKKQTIYFEQVSELANLLMMTFHKQDYPFKEAESLQMELEEILEEALYNDKDDMLDKQLHKKIEKLLH